MKKRKKNQRKIIITCTIILGIIIIEFFNQDLSIFIDNLTNKLTPSYALSEIPEYNGQDYVIINNNEPNFTQDMFSTTSYEKYSPLDYLNRAQMAIANIGSDLMPSEKRESIGMIKPSGWHTIKYDNIEGKYLYNRCHLIGYQLTGENANEKNLITCTRQTNTQGMLDFENQIADYIHKTNNHVLYRVTPIYENTNLIASGIHLEAQSVEDDGAGIKFNVYVYNVQQGIKINYEDGTSQLKE